MDTYHYPTAYSRPQERVTWIQVACVTDQPQLGGSHTAKPLHWICRFSNQPAAQSKGQGTHGPEYTTAYLYHHDEFPMNWNAGCLDQNWISKARIAATLIRWFGNSARGCNNKTIVKIRGQMKNYFFEFYKCARSVLLDLSGTACTLVILCTSAVLETKSNVVLSRVLAQ